MVDECEGWRKENDRKVRGMEEEGWWMRVRDGEGRVVDEFEGWKRESGG